MKIILLVLLLSVTAQAQSNDRLRQTWKSPDMSPLLDLLKEGEKNSPRQAADTQVLKLQTAGNSGVAEELANALGRTKKERSQILAEFRQFRKDHEAELANTGHSFNLSNAMVIFITFNLLANGRAEVASKEDIPKAFQSLEQMMARVPAVAAMSEAEKQRLYDWLIYTGIFAFSKFMDANLNADIEARSRIEGVAENALRLVFGVEARNLSITGPRLILESAAERSAKLINEIAGPWTTSSDQNGAYVRLRYIFNADGTYSFKSERKDRAQRCWTIEETGSLSVDKSSLTISPQVSRTTLRSVDGVVQETRANPLEKVTYTWRTLRLENTSEMNLMLQPPKPTRRDGMRSRDNVPAAYLYTRGDKLEWGF